MRDDHTMPDPTQPPHADRPKRPGLWVALVLLVLGGLGAAYYLTTRGEPAGEPPPEAEVTEAEVMERVDAGVAPEAADAGDVALEPEPRGKSPTEILRQYGARGSGSETLDGWLSAPGVLRRLAAAVHQVAQGESPRKVLDFIEIQKRFSVVESWDPEAHEAGLLPGGVGRSEDRIFIDPRSYDRYDEIAGILAAADTKVWARGYRRLRPYFERIFREVAEPGQRFDDVLARALGRVAAAEIPGEQPELTEKGAVFLFKDPALEGRSEVDKHLIRMGPENAAAVQEAARDFARHAGLRLEAGR